jgi:hypothetical protein
MSAAAYADLKPGQRIRITHTVRIGLQSWPAVVTGAVRDLNVLVTGLTVDRGADDVVAVPTLHFVKDNGELSSITLDENTQIELL